MSENRTPVRFDVTKVTERALEVVAKYGPVGVCIIFGDFCFLLISIVTKNVTITATAGIVLLASLCILLFAEDQRAKHVLAVKRQEVELKTKALALRRAAERDVLLRPTPDGKS